MSIKAMEMALEALNEAIAFREGGRQKAIDAVNALRTAIQQAEAQRPVTGEPVYWGGASSAPMTASMCTRRMAMELECLLLDTKDTAAVSRWWKSANDALDLHRARLAAAQAKGDAHD